MKLFMVTKATVIHLLITQNMLAVFGVRSPLAFDGDGFARLQCRERSRDDNDFFAFEVVQAHHGKAVLQAMERDAFYAAFDVQFRALMEIPARRRE